MGSYAVRVSWFEVLRAGKNNKLNFLWPKMARLGPPFDTKIPPKKFMWVPFLRSFPGNETRKLFSGGPKWRVLGGDQKVYVEEVYVLLPSLHCSDREEQYPSQKLTRVLRRIFGINTPNFLEVAFQVEESSFLRTLRQLVGWHVCRTKASSVNSMPRSELFAMGPVQFS